MLQGFLQGKEERMEKICGYFDSKIPTLEIWSLIRVFKRRNLALSNYYTADPFKERQSFQEAIQKLCPPSCFQDNQRV